MRVRRKKQNIPQCRPPRAAVVGVEEHVER